MPYHKKSNVLRELKKSPSEDEEARIKAVYDRRRCTVPASRLSIFNKGNLFINQQAERRVLDLLQRHGCSSLGTKTILEIGCGTGYWLRDFVQWGARPENIVGVDLLSGRVAEAKHLCPSAVRIQCGNATQLEFPDAFFDLVLQCTVFTSVLDCDVKEKLASEMLRVLKRGGLILWYDYHINNPRNPDVRGVKKQHIYQLFPGCRIELRQVTLAPPLARLLASYSWLACYLLEKIPWLCTHYLGAIRKENDKSG